MSRPQEPNRPFFPFGNPFKMMLPKGSSLSPKLLSILSTFEENLAQRLKNLKPVHMEDVISLSWMKTAMESLSKTHTDVKDLITALELPVYDWEDKWVDVYLDNSVKLLDICIAFSSELSRLNQGQLLLQCALHNLNSTPSKQLVKASSSFHSWRQHISSKNPRLENCFGILENLTETLNLPKIKNSAKGKVLMRAMFGVKVETIFVCSIFAAAFSGSAKKMIDLHVPDTCLWAPAFYDVQTFVNGEIRNLYANGKVTVVKELEGVDASVLKLYPMVLDGVDHAGTEAFENNCSELVKKTQKLSVGLDHLTKEVDGFFQIVLSGRDTLLGNLRVGVPFTGPVSGNSMEGQAMRLNAEEAAPLNLHFLSKALGNAGLVVSMFPLLVQVEVSLGSCSPQPAFVLDGGDAFDLGRCTICRICLCHTQCEHDDVTKSWSLAAGVQHTGFSLLRQFLDREFALHRYYT